MLIDLFRCRMAPLATAPPPSCRMNRGELQQEGLLMWSMWGLCVNATPTHSLHNKLDFRQMRPKENFWLCQTRFIFIQNSLRVYEVLKVF